MGRIVNYNEVDPAVRYFEFYAAPNSNAGNSEFGFLGTFVYYKIYSNPSTMTSNHNSIEAVNNSSNYSAAAERMIGLKYQELRMNNEILTPFAAGDHVRIRLTNFQENDNREISTNAQIEVNETYVGIPRRKIGPAFSFDFGRYDKNYDSNIKYDAPNSGDEDFDGGSPSDGKYYVDMYAVAAGRDTTFARYYSNVTYLGSITINANEENN